MGSKTRNGVHLVENNHSLRRQEKVHSGEATAVQSAVDGLGRFLDIPCLFRRDAGGTVDAGGDQVILLSVVEESLGQFNLVQCPHGQLLITHDSAAHFKAGNGFLQ